MPDPALPPGSRLALILLPKHLCLALRDRSRLLLFSPTSIHVAQTSVMRSSGKPTVKRYDTALAAIH